MKKILLLSLTLIFATELEVDGDVLEIKFDHTLTDSEDAHHTLVAMLKAMPKSSC